MELLSRTHPEFIAKLHGRDFVIQISTDEGSHRFFHIQRNRVTSRNTLHEAPSMAMHFATDEAAMRLLVKGDANTFMAAMQQGDVKVTGDYALLMWFMGIGRYLRPRIGRGRPHADSGTAPTAG